MNTNTYLASQYPSPPCWQLVADVYRRELAAGVLDYCTINASVRAVASAFRLALYKSDHGFAQIAEPVDYCVVLLGKSASLGLHHCGVYYAGKVLHGLATGNQYQDLASLLAEYPLHEYWSKAA